MPECFRHKLDVHISKTLENKPKLVKISSAWNSREGAPLGRNHYVELQIKKAKTNGTATKLPPVQKPCEKMTEAIVMDGGKRGQIVKVCADPACRVHHPNTPSPEQVARERIEERKRIEKTKLAITTRHRALAAVLERVSAPLKKADLLTVVHHVIGQLPYNQVPTLAKRHKIEEGKSRRLRRNFWPSASAPMTKPRSAAAARNQSARLCLHAFRRIRRSNHGRRQTVSRGCRKAGEGRDC